MEIPKTFIREKTGWYRCACQYKCDTLDDALLHMQDGGFCENGIRMCPDNTYECRCGIRNMSRIYVAFTHYYENKGECIKKKQLESDTFCKTCNKRFHTIFRYERHLETKLHSDILNKVEILPLKCEICNIKCQSQDRIRKHLNSAKHKQQEQGCVPESLFCKICNIKCRGQKEMIAHLATRKHMKKNGLLLTTKNETQ